MRNRPLTVFEIERIRELRYADGLTNQRIADMFDLHESTVRRHARGRPGKAPVAPLREAFLASAVTAADVARSLGWWASDKVDTSRVKRTLGIYPDKTRGCVFYRTFTDVETIQRIADAIGISPWSVLPDEDVAA